MHHRASERSAAAWVIVTSSLCAGLAGCVAPPTHPTPPPPSAADAAFEQLGARYLDEMLALTPVAATQLGDHRYDDRLDDIGPTARGERATLAHGLLGQLTAINAAQLSRAHQVDALLLKNELEYSIWRLEVQQDWRSDPLLYIALAGDGLYLLMARDFAPLPVRLDNAAARLEALPRLFAQMRDTLEPARVPRINAETAIRQNAGLLSLIDETIAPQIGALPAADQARLKSALERARTAISQQQIWLEKRLLPEAHGDFRLGATLYDAKLRFALSSTLSRQEIRTRAEAELVRARAEMYALARTVLSGRADAPPLPEMPQGEEEQTAIAAALQLAEADQPQRSQVFDTARQAFAQAERFVREHDLMTLYDDPLQIIPMPTYQRGVALAYCDAPGPLDRGQPTFYAIAPIPAEWTDAQVHSYLSENNRRAINELTFHEAMPGHYVQLAHSDRYDSALRAALQSGTFIEGWAVYAEQLMSEQRYMDGDPLMQLVHLKWYLRSVGNAILDQAVHVDGITRDAAMRMMMHDTFQEEREADAKWVRVQLTSAQLPTYFVGVQEHLALRTEARTRWGKQFSLKRYHDTVLSFGSPPVRYVRELMFDLPIG
jgi:uncharacterized protein (DUF885 family)